MNRKGNLMSYQTKQSSPSPDDEDEDNSGSEGLTTPPSDPRKGVERTFATYDRG